MRRINIANPTFEYDQDDPAGFKAGMARVGPSLGAKTTGTSVYELPAGETLCPYHYEYGEEEWLLVLEGRPTVRHPDGTDQLDQWDLVFFPSGPDGAHRVQNDRDETVRILMYSSVTTPAARRLSGQRQDRDLDRQPGRRRDGETQQPRRVLRGRVAAVGRMWVEFPGGVLVSTWSFLGESCKPRFQVAS